MERGGEITSESSKAYSAAKVCVQPKSMEGCVDSVMDERFDLHGRGGKVGREASLSWQSVEVALEGRWWLSNTRRPSLLELERACANLLPGGEVDQGDGDGVTWHQGVAVRISVRLTFVRGILHLGGGSEGKRLHALDVVPIVTGHLGHEKQ